MKKSQEIFNRLQNMHPMAGCELNFSTPFELLVAVILSAQCTDIRVNIATEKLFKVYNTAEQFAALTLDELKGYIFSCGFYNNKGKNIISMSKALMERFNGEVPKTLDELITLDGVGRKTASVVLAVAFDIPAMPVDTHVFRVANRLGFSETKNVDVVEEDLKKAFPIEQWNPLHHYLIFHGRYICKSQNPDCKACTLQKFCIYYNKKTKI